MKNPFEKNDHKILIAGAVVGSIAAGAAAYLFLTETGSQVRQQLAGHFGRMRDAFMGGRAEEPQSEPQAYLQHKDKAPKTDREKLLKHEVLHDPAAHSGDAAEQQS